MANETLDPSGGEFQVTAEASTTSDAEQPQSPGALVTPLTRIHTKIVSEELVEPESYL